MRNGLLVLLTFILGVSESAFAHGGSHPTPLPPAPTPSPSSPASVRPPIPVPRRKPLITGEEKGIAGNALVTTVVEFLIKQTEHDYFDVRGAASIALGRGGSRSKPMAVVPIEKRTGDENRTAAESASLALGMLPSKPSVPLLVEILTNPESHYRMRTFSAVALGLCRDSSAVRTMEDLLANRKEHEQVRASCMLGMAMAKDERSIVSLLKVLNHPGEKEDIRAMAATAIGKAGFCEAKMGKRTLNVVETLARLLSAPKTKGKLKISLVLALTALGPSGRLTPERLMALIERIYGAERNLDVRAYILLGVAELAKKGPLRDPARALLRKALQEETTPPALSFACAGAGLAKDPESIPELRRIFTTKKDPESRGAAAVSLGLLKDAESVPLILAVVVGKAPPGLKAQCCLALGLMGCKDDKSVKEALRKILEEGKNPQVQGAAGMALMLLDVSNALDVLLRVVKEGGSYLRQSLIMTIGYSRDLRAARPLMDLFESDEVNDEIRAMIVTALGYIIEEAEEPVLKRLSKHYNLMLSKYDGIMQIMALL